MPKAKSLVGRTVTVRRWRIFVDGRVQDAQGHFHEELPVEVAYSQSCVELAKQKVLEVEGIKSDTGSDLKPTPVAVVHEDVVTSAVVEEPPRKWKGKK